MKIQLEPLLKELCRLSEAQAALGSPRPPAFPPSLSVAEFARRHGLGPQRLR